jgi:hypothetical protein
MQDILFHYRPVNPTTWAYLSSLLMIGLYFKFGRLWSLRNLDLFLLISLAPGLILAQYVNPDSNGRPSDADLQIQYMGFVWLFVAGGLILLRLLSDPAMVRRPLLEPNLSLGGMTFIGVSLFFFLMANVLTSKPDAVSLAAAKDPQKFFQDDKQKEAPKPRSPLENTPVENTPTANTPTENKPAEKIEAKDRSPDSPTPPSAAPSSATPSSASDIQPEKKSPPAPNPETTDELPPPANRLSRYGPGFPYMFQLSRLTTRAISDLVHPLPPATEQEREIAEMQIDAITVRLMAILCQLAVVTGIVLIGYRHFDNYKTGVAVALIYLMLPYTAQKTGDPYHVLAPALLVWVLVTYRRPLISGLLMGLLIGTFYYPVALLPLWLSFYWKRGLFRFTSGVLTSIALLVGSLVVIAVSNDAIAELPDQLRQMFGFAIPRIEGLGGFWHAKFTSPYYRIPVLAAFIAMSGSFALWPVQKNFGTLLSCSAAIMLGAQFWHGHGGGLFVGWYLPALLLTIFRPNLEDRIALAVLPEARRPRWLASPARTAKAA